MMKIKTFFITKGYQKQIEIANCDWKQLDKMVKNIYCKCINEVKFE